MLWTVGLHMGAVLLFELWFGLPVAESPVWYFRCVCCIRGFLSLVGTCQS